MKLTQRQSQYYESMRLFALEHNRAPTTVEIAKLMGVCHQTASRMVASLKRAGLRLHFSMPQSEILPEAAAVHRAIRNQLAAKAQQRGVTPAELTNEILLRIVNDDLFDAVLDDGER